MSVLVRGMEMPDDCTDCLLLDDTDYCVLLSEEDNAKAESTEQLKEKCPLVEVAD